MNVTSGARRERIVRNSIFTAMCVVFGAWFAYDGWKGYPQKNFEESRLQIPSEDRTKADAARVYAAANQAQISEIARTLRDAPPLERRAALESHMGGLPTFENEKSVYYFGQDGLVIIEKSGSRLAAEAKAVPAEHSMTTLRSQKALGMLLGAVGLAMLIFVVYVARARAVVTDAGLSIRGRTPIPFAAMRRLDSQNFRRKGRIDLIHVDAAGQEQRLTLDEYHYADFPAIIAAICAATSFEDPVALEQAEKAARRNA